MPVNFPATKKRAEAADARRIRDGGLAAGAIGQALLTKYITPLAEHLEKVMAERPPAYKRPVKSLTPEIWDALQDIPEDVMAAAMLRGCINATDIIGQKAPPRVYAAIGNELQIQARGRAVRRILRDKLGKDAGSKEFAKLGKLFSGEASTYKKLRAEYVALRAHKITVDPWPHEFQGKVGAFACDMLLTALPDVIVADRHKVPRISAQAAHALEINYYTNPIYEPSTEPSVPWFAFDDAVGDTFVANCRDVPAVREAIARGIPHVDAVNYLKATRFRINEHVLNVVRTMRGWSLTTSELLAWAYPHGRTNYTIKRGAAARKEFSCVGLVRFTMVRPWADLLKKVKDEGAANLLEQNIRMADRFAWWPFNLPMRIDFRGRLLVGPNLNFTAPDHIRGLFTLAETAELTESGLYWLKIACATSYDEYKEVSKQTFAKRLAWTESNLERICQAGRNPLDHLSWLESAGDPIQCIALFHELASAIEHGPGYSCSVPIGFDASCSALQHFALLARDVSAAKKTNLIPTMAEDVEPWTGEGDPDRSVPGHVYQAPQDIYDYVRRHVHMHLASRGKWWLAKWWLNGRLDRKIIKGLVVTYGYSAKEWGQKSGVYKELKRRREKFTERHVSYLVDLVRRTIETHIPAAKTVMETLQVLVTKTEPVRWTSPSGLPVANSYQRAQTSTVRVYLQGRLRRSDMSTGWKPGQRFAKAKSAIAPNYIHSLDAAHMALVANACARHGIALVTVHDSFNVLPPHADRLREILLEELREMYRSYEALVQPTGDLNLEEVTGPYAFS